MKRKELALHIDATLVKNIHTEKEIEHAIKTVIDFQTAALFTMPYYTKMVSEGLDKTNVRVGGVSAFPWGASNTDIKVMEAAYGIANGAQEMDMVMNLNLLRDKKYSEIIDDIKAVKAIVGKRPLKVIIEAPVLDDDEILRASELVIQGGGDYVKTGTGFNGSASVKQVELIKKAIGNDGLIKAAGGIRTYEDAEVLLKAGATRLGIGFASAVNILNSVEE